MHLNNCQSCVQNTIDLFSGHDVYVLSFNSAICTVLSCVMSAFDTRIFYPILFLHSV